MAVALHQRAAEQGNVEALLSVGDSFWYGRGAPRDWRRAAEVYTAASKLQSSQVLRLEPSLTISVMSICEICTSISEQVRIPDVTAANVGSVYRRRSSISASCTSTAPACLR